MFKFADIVILLLLRNDYSGSIALLESQDVIRCATLSPLTENLLTLSAGSELESRKKDVMSI